MIRIAIVEDEQIYIEQIQAYLEKYRSETGEEFSVTVYGDGDSIVEKYRAQFDIILMDIQMKFMDGMSAAQEIRKMDSEVIIMFVTNMVQYAIRGYEVDALDYILKPLVYLDFSQRLRRAIERLHKRERKFITLSVRGGILRLDVSDIHYVESEGHKLIYHTASENHLVQGTMKMAEELLKDYSFSRGNKCYLINLAHVEGVREKCAVVNGESLQLSRPRLNAFMQDLARYWGD